MLIFQIFLLLHLLLLIDLLTPCAHVNYSVTQHNFIYEAHLKATDADKSVVEKTKLTKTNTIIDKKNKQTPKTHRELHLLMGAKHIAVEDNETRDTVNSVHPSIHPSITSCSK